MHAQRVQRQPVTDGCYYLLFFLRENKDTRLLRHQELALAGGTTRPRLFFGVRTEEMFLPHLAPVEMMMT